MPSTLYDVYGEDAWGIIPPTYSLPAQLNLWRQALRADLAAHKPQRHPQPQMQQPHRMQQEAVPVQPPGAAVCAAWSASSAGTGSAAGDLAATAVVTAEQHADAGAGPQEALWILKTPQHLGKGLKVVPARWVPCMPARTTDMRPRTRLSGCERTTEHPLLMQHAAVRGACAAAATTGGRRFCKHG